MTISELAVAVYLYECYTADEGYRKFRDATNGKCNLAERTCREALIKWLNNWGCRQFALKHHDLASRELLEWHKEFKRKLPPAGAKLWTLTDTELDGCGELFNSLANKRASVRRTKTGRSNVRVGATGAAKILFAIRPDVFPPWDDPIRTEGGYLGPMGFARFLKDTKRLVLDLKRRCEGSNIPIENLPTVLNRPRSSVPKLIDEYYWVTVTHGCRLPSPERLREWARWSESR